jgi:hypothetical protein
MYSFEAILEIIGINPFVYVPEQILVGIQKSAGKQKGPIPVKGSCNGQYFIQTLVRYQGAYRLYINTSILSDSPKKVGQRLKIEIDFDPKPREIPISEAFSQALQKNKAAQDAFERLTPSRQKEILRYLGHLKSEISIHKNVKRAIDFLLGNARFVGRDQAL